MNKTALIKNSPKIIGDNVYFGDDKMSGLTEARMLEIIDFWNIPKGEGDSVSGAFNGFFESFIGLALEDNEEVIEMIRQAVLFEAKAIKEDLMLFKKKELQEMLDIAMVSYETDANKQTLVSLLDSETLPTEDEDDDDYINDDVHNSVDNFEDDDVYQTVEELSHYVAVSRIKCDGKVYEAGDKYNGKYVGKLVSSGVIEPVYK